MRRRKSNYFILILIAIFCISVGYAVINRTLYITGNSEVKQNTWNIYFDNVSVKSGSVTANTPVIDTTTKSTVNFNVMLNLPGDFYEFTVDVVNSGTIDAMVDSVVKTPELTDVQKKYINYIIEYQNGEQITLKQLVKANEAVRLKVRVEYRTDLTEYDLPTVAETLNLGFTVNYVQADDTGISVLDNGVFKITANGSLDDIGTIVTIGTEQFYTIGTEGNNVKLLSMYNLYVGGFYDTSLGVWTEYGAEATGMQDENMKGMLSGQTVRNGITAFSNANQKGTKYSDYNGSLVEKYVNNYKSLLESKYEVDILSARLITSDELIASETFGCVKYGYCSDKYPWIYSTSYWTGTAYDADDVWSLDSASSFNFIDYDDSKFMGVRPVIVMKKSDIVVEIKPVANGSLDDIGTIVTIGDQQFYTIGTEGDNVKLLSMYNLYVGNQSDGINIVALASPTGKQSEDAIGYFDGYSVDNPSIGVTAFSSDSQKGTNYSDYKGSIVEGYVNNYKTILENEYGVEVLEARLITKEELTSEEIGCSAESNTCINAPSFIYSTSYWSGSADFTYYVWLVDSNGFFDVSYCYSDGDFGVRPVIIISKSLF